MERCIEKMKLYINGNFPLKKSAWSSNRSCSNWSNNTDVDLKIIQHTIYSKSNENINYFFSTC